MAPNIATNTRELSILSRLHSDGALSNEEFELLRRNFAGETLATAGLVENAQGRSRLSGVWLCATAAVVLVFADHMKGPIFPDEIYCMLGAGRSFVVAGRTEANSWSANNGCDASRPEC